MEKLKDWFLSSINVYKEEYVAVTTMWSLSFIYRVAMVLGWTVLVAFFVGEYGVKFLPILFGLHAFGNILGSLFFGHFIHKISKVDLSLYLSLFISFLFGLTAFVYKVSPEIFLSFGVISISVFLSQFKIIRSLFAESIFSPTQASRVFPVIESAETIGVLVGGGMVAFLSVVVPLYKIFLVMMGGFLLCVPVLFWYMHKTVSVPYRSFFSIPELGIGLHEDEEMTFSGMFTKIKTNKFIAYLFVIILLQFFFFGILEYHFTSVVEAFSKSHHIGGENVSADSSLASDLGLLHSVFAGVVLFFQLFAASRILRVLGIVNSMLISPIIMLVSTICMVIGFGFPSVVMSRFNQEVTHVLHYNAYHTSYYALSHRLRAALMEFLEGVVRPVGTILSMFVVGLMLYVFGDSFVLYSNLIGVLALIGVIYATKNFENEFNESPYDTLRFSNSVGELMNAVDVMTSIRDKNEVISFLKDILVHRSDLPSIVEGRIYTYIGDHGEANDIFFLIEQFSATKCSYEILESVNDLYLNNKAYFLEKQFTSVLLKDFYEELLNSEMDKKTYRELLIFMCVFYMQESEVENIIELISDVMNEENCLAFVEALENVDDIGLRYALDKFMNFDNVKVKICLLMIVKKYLSDEELNVYIRSCLVSSNEMTVVYGLIFVIKYNLFDLTSMYKELLLEKAKSSEMIKFFCQVLENLSGGNDYDFKVYLSQVEIESFKEFVGVCEEWSILDRVQLFVKQRYEAEIYNLYGEFTSVVKPEMKLEVLYKLKNAYRDFGARREYFMLKDLLS